MVWNKEDTSLDEDVLRQPEFAYSTLDWGMLNLSETKVGAILLVNQRSVH